MRGKILCAAALAAAVAWGGTAMPLKNGGFEDGMAGWNTDDHGMTLFLEDAAATGRTGIRITDGSLKHGSELVSAKLPAQAGALYGVSLTTREHRNASGIIVYIVFYDADGKTLTVAPGFGERGRRLTGGGQWHPFALAARAVPGTAAVGVRIHSLKSSESQADVDDIRLVEYTEEESQRPDIKAITVEKKMTENIDDLKLHVEYSRIEEAMAPLEASIHPRLFVSGQAFENLRQDALENDGIRNRLFVQMCREADWIVTQPVQERVLEGRRLLQVSRVAEHRITTLALCYKIAGKTAWRDRAIAELRAVCAFSDWNPSHFLDVAQMTLGVAVGYDWLYDELSDEDREAFAEAIWTKGLRSAPPDAHWRTNTHNWAQVCHAGMIAGALAIAERHTEFCRRQLHESICNLAIPMRTYAPCGNYPEGPGYWSYGTGRNILALMMLQQAFGTDFGLGDLPGFRETAYYNELVTGPSDMYFSYADGRPMKRHSKWQLWWFANRYDMPELLELSERSELEKILADKLPSCLDPALNELNPMLFFLVFEREEGTPAPKKLPLVWSPQGEIPIVVMRSSWNRENAVFVGLKGGSASGPHAHQDGGAFVLDTHGIRWFADLGPEGYHRIEAMGLNLWSGAQDADRWKLFRYSNRGHNTLVIDGHPQLVKGFVTIVEAVDGENKRAVMDMTSDYADVCTKALRTVTLAADGTVTVTDELAGLTPGAEVVWGANTFTHVDGIEGDAVTLSQNGKTLRVVSESGAGAWRTVDACNPRPFFQGDSPNPGLIRLELVAAAPADGRLALRVVMK